MLAAALIVFREVLEAALVVTIVMAATRGMPHRGKWILAGITGGIMGAGLVAALTTAISASFAGAGQEIVNASILFIAVGLISWHVAWMNSHGRKIASELRATAKKVAEGERHMSILAVVVGLAVMREGSEIVLMLEGLWAGSGAAHTAMFAGGMLGVAGGVATGALMYSGLLALSLPRMFTLTNGLLVLIASGMAAHGANFLDQAGILPSLGSRLWDTSFILSYDSIPGQALGALVGYIARPSGIEVLFYVATLIAVVALIRFTKHGAFSHHKTLAAVALIAGCFALTHSAKAGEVISPYVEEHEWEFEQQGIYTTHDSNADNRNAQDLETEIGYSPTNWWRTEFEGEFARDPGPDQENLHYDSFNWENTFQLAEPGEYWLDPGFFYEMDFGRGSGPNDIIAGPVIAKQIGETLTTMNFFLHHEFGNSANPHLGFAYSDQTKYLWKLWMQPGFEVYGDTDGQDSFRNQQLAAGPGLFGTLPTSWTGAGRELKYEIAYLFGATPASPTQAIRWKLEYEFFF